MFDNIELVRNECCVVKKYSHFDEASKTIRYNADEHGRLTADNLSKLLKK